MVIGKFLITPLGDGLFSIRIIGDGEEMVCKESEFEKGLQQFYDENF